MEIENNSFLDYNTANSGGTRAEYNVPSNTTNANG
jgi:hypothetical protein